MERQIFYGAAGGFILEHLVRDSEYSMSNRHFHATYEFYFLLEGERYYFIDSETYTVRAGDVVIIGPERIHKTSQAGSPRHERVLMQIDPVAVGSFLRAAGLGGMEELFGPGCHILTMPEALRQQVAARLDRIKGELERREEKYAAAANLEVAGLLLDLRRACVSDPVPAAPVQDLKHQKVREAAQYLSGHPETGESLEELAGRFYISRSYLSRIFREVTGFSVTEFRNICRIKRARQLLEHSRLSVTEIAAGLGFESVTYFERVFRKYTGLSPLGYRKKGGDLP